MVTHLHYGASPDPNGTGDFFSMPFNHAERTGLHFTGGATTTDGDPDDGRMYWYRTALGVIFAWSRGDEEASSEFTLWDENAAWKPSWLAPRRSASRNVNGRMMRCALHIAEHEVVVYHDAQHFVPEINSLVASHHTDNLLKWEFDRAMDALGFVCFTPWVALEVSPPPSDFDADFWDETGDTLYASLRSSWLETGGVGDTPTRRPPTTVSGEVAVYQWYVLGQGSVNEFAGMRGNRNQVLGTQGIEIDTHTGVPIDYNWFTFTRITGRLDHDAMHTLVVNPVDLEEFAVGLPWMYGWAVLDLGAQPYLRKKQRDDRYRATHTGRNAPTSSQAGGRAGLRNRYD